MSIFNEFYDGILPGNYALTKSMELSKCTMAGTLWYIKKYIVWYYYIFLSGNKINTNAYCNEIQIIFSNYINKLPQEKRKDAQSFFFPDVDVINCSSQKFRYFTDFIGSVPALSDADRLKFYGDAKKYYFAFIMMSGGQSDTNAYIQKELLNEKFEFKNIFNINYNGGIIYRAKEQNPKEKRPLLEIYNDFHAFVRNERQILYYYGYFHAKSCGSKDKEFSSLTPIGELAIIANPREFLAIYEHQKIKMISQPINVTIASLKPSNLSIDKFSISFSPYLDILNTIDRRGYLTFDEYKYIISRKNENFPSPLWENSENEIFQNINAIKCKIESFNRIRDCKNEDSHKELKKYLIGIQDDIPKDYGKNPIGICIINGKKIQFTDKEKSNNTILRVYRFLDSYKKEKYQELFYESLNELRKKYILDTNSSTNRRQSGVKANQKTVFHWNYFMLMPEHTILLGVIIAIHSTENNIPLDDIKEYSNDLLEKYPSIFAEMKLSSEKRLRNEIEKIKDAILNNNYNYSLNEDSHNILSIKCSDLLNKPCVDLFNQITEYSNNSSTISIKYGDIIRNRNTKLIRLIKAYYIQKYSEDGLLKCECCGNTTFLSKSEESFVEFHHIIPFSEARGPDHYLNIVALCPNCHRKMHFIKQDLKKNEYRNLNQNNYLKTSLFERLNKLKLNGILKSYHLEYLFSEDAISQDEYDSLSEA